MNKLWNKSIFAGIVTTFISLLSYQTAHAAFMPTGGIGGSLLYAINAQRSGAGLGTLSMNGALSSAAQAKAYDMVAQDYWSHTSPSGVQPWAFISGAGYVYSIAGENLAYGYASASDVLTGWMNSAEHRANILNSGYTEVGFGVANSDNYQQSGQQTIVVAEFAAPQYSPAPQPAPAAPTTPATPAAPTGAQPVSSAPSSTATPTSTSPATADPSPTSSKTPTSTTARNLQQKSVADKITSSPGPVSVTWPLLAATLTAAGLSSYALIKRLSWHIFRINNPYATTQVDNR